MNGERKIAFLRKQVDTHKATIQSLKSQIESLQRENQFLKNAEAERDEAIKQLKKDNEVRQNEHDRRMDELKEQIRKFKAAQKEMDSMKNSYRKEAGRLLDKMKNKT